MERAALNGEKKNKRIEGAAYGVGAATYGQRRKKGVAQQERENAGGAGKTMVR